MKINKISDDENGKYTIYLNEDIEYADPVKYYSESILKFNFAFEKQVMLPRINPFHEPMLNKVLTERAEKEWEKKYQEFLSLEIPSNFLTLLNSNSKNEQIKLLRNQKFNSNQLIAFFIVAGVKFGYKFSQYTAEHYHNGLDLSSLPKVIEVVGDEVKKIGETILSDGQLKQVVRHRKRLISRIIDNGETWHCFFGTIKSMYGDENWQGGQAHLHYISDKFGIKREKVVEQLKSKNYKLGNLPHIALERTDL